MNEILALIYYCFSQDVNEFFLENYEVDVFFCFTLLMGEIKDVFIRNLDHTNGKIIIYIIKNFIVKSLNKKFFFIIVTFI
jgi:hypothetical protein